MPEGLLAYQGLRYAVHPDVYDPADDTFLLLDALKVARGARLVEIGTGAGLVAIHAAREGARVVATDVNPSACRLSRQNARRNGVRAEFLQTDLLAGLRAERFDVFAFNPPYLPTQPHDRVPGPLDRAFDGGPDGRRVLERFLGGPRLPEGWLVASSLQGFPAIEALFREAGYGFEVRARQAHAMEELRVYHLAAHP